MKTYVYVIQHKITTHFSQTGAGKQCPSADVVTGATITIVNVVTVISGHLCQGIMCLQKVAKAPDWQETQRYSNKSYVPVAVAVHK